MLRKVSDDFRDNILLKLRDDAVGKLCKSDDTIVAVGKRMYEKMRRKVDKADEVRKSMRMDMRRVANPLMSFIEVKKRGFSRRDMQYWAKWTGKGSNINAGQCTSRLNGREKKCVKTYETPSPKNGLKVHKMA